MFQPGNIIVFADEFYEVTQGGESSGKVQYLDGSPVGLFYWHYDGETARLATADELTSIRASNEAAVTRALGLLTA